MMKQTGFVLPQPSTSLVSEVRTDFSGSVFRVYFDYDREGEIFHSALIFHGVRAFRFRSVYHCTAWHIDGAYDTLMEVVNSDWIEELWKALPVDLRTNNVRPKHFMIFLDSTGCFEVAARYWESLPEKEGPWNWALCDKLPNTDMH